MIKPLTHPPKLHLFPVFQDDFRSCLHLLPPKKDSISFFLCLYLSYISRSNYSFFCILVIGAHIVWFRVTMATTVYICIYMNLAQRRRGKKKSLNITRRKTSKLSMATALLITWDFSYLFLLLFLLLLPFLQVFLLRAVSCFRGREGILPEKRYLFMLRPLKYSPLNEKSFFVVSN